jgi:predicted phage-related endonuclease
MGMLKSLINYKIPKNKRLRCSDLFIIFDLSYESIFDLIEYTIGTKIQVFSEESKRFMRHGVNNEKKALKWFMEKFKIEHVDKPYYRFSDWNERFVGAADGVISSDEIIEIKCPQKMYDVTSGTCKDYKFMYYIQIQGELLLYDAKKCHFIVYIDDNNVHHEIVERDDDFIENILKPKIEMYFALLDSF